MTPRVVSFLFGPTPGDESEAAVDRRAVASCAFAGACLLLAPGEFRAGGILFITAIGLWLHHRISLAREAAQEPTLGPQR